MTRGGKIAICLAGGLAFSASLRADDAVVLPGNPYAPIVARNIFDLSPPPPPVDLNQVPANPPPQITATGIMTIFGIKQVLFQTQPAVGRGQALKPSYYILATGERQDDIEVVRINEQTDVITFNNHGEIQNVPLANSPVNSATIAATAPLLGNRFGGNNFNNVANQFGGRFSNHSGGINAVESNGAPRGRGNGE